jgi:L-fucose isomerase-like protein
MPGSWTRRDFAKGSAAGLAAATAAGSNPLPWGGLAQVRKVYIAVPKPTWPRPTIDVAQTRQEIEARLAEVERRHPNLIRFTGGELVRTMDQARAWVKSLEDQDVDGNLVVTITSGSDGMVRAIGESGLPTLLFLRPYAGHAWASFSEFAQRGHKADVLASSNYNDLDVYVRIFGAIHHLRKSKVIVVVPGARRSALADDFSKHFGTTFTYLTYADLKSAYDAVDARQVQQAAEDFMRGALRIVEPTREPIERALRFYLGAQNLLRQEKANALTMDCLGGINRGELPGYPCVTFSRLNDQGLYGVCQAELDCAITQLLLTPFSGKPGFLANLVMDTGRNEIIHSHCTAPTTMLGIGGPTSPYIIRTHLETAAGVSLQVLMPIAETVTVAKFEHARRLMLSTGEVSGNVDSESGCRTQIRTRVKDARKMLGQFRTNVHRVIYYGDYTSSIEKMGRLMAFEVVHEM